MGSRITGRVSWPTPGALLDFLAPALSRPRTRARSLSTTAATAIPSPSSESSPAAVFPAPTAASVGRAPLRAHEQAFLDRALRVNQAGELAATLIYTAQTPTLTQSHPELRPLMRHMYDQEAGHFRTFNALLAKHRVRPTAMYPVWQLAATALGWGTAMMGREAAMACTEAVETEIGDHYNGQVRTLLQMARDVEARGEKVGEEVTKLIETIRQIRDEELEHLDHAVDHDAKSADGHELLTTVIRTGCRAAIWVSERV